MYFTATLPMTGGAGPGAAHWYIGAGPAASTSPATRAPSGSGPPPAPSPTPSPGRATSSWRARTTACSTRRRRSARCCATSSPEGARSYIQSHHVLSLVGEAAELAQRDREHGDVQGVGLLQVLEHALVAVDRGAAVADPGLDHRLGVRAAAVAQHLRGELALRGGQVVAQRRLG